MGFLDDIKNKIFGHHEQAVVQTASVTPPPAPAAAPAPTPAAAAPQAAAPTAAPAPSAPSPAPQAAPAASAAAPVDVAAILDKAVAASGQKLDWRKSIVDLMKALGIDSSLSARKDLAKELGYTGDTSDSAAMNIWLHKQVIQKLKDNGGKVPADLL